MKVVGREGDETDQGTILPGAMTDTLIAALEEALRLVDKCRGGHVADPEIDEVMRGGKAAIRKVRQAERDNALLVRRQPPGPKLEGWDI